MNITVMKMVFAAAEQVQEGSSQLCAGLLFLLATSDQGPVKAYKCALDVTRAAANSLAVPFVLHAVHVHG